MGENCDHEHESAGEKVIQDAMMRVLADMGPDGEDGGNWPASAEADQLNAWTVDQLNLLTTKGLNIACALEAGNTESHDAHSQALVRMIVGYSQKEALSLLHAFAFALGAAIKAADMSHEATFLEYAEFVKRQREEEAESGHPLSRLAKELKEPEND